MGFPKACFLLLLTSLVAAAYKEGALWNTGRPELYTPGKAYISPTVRRALPTEHVISTGSYYPHCGVLILMLYLALSAIKRRNSVTLLSLGLSATDSPFARTPGVRGETVFDCTNPKNTIADVDLSVVEECPDFVSTYGNATLVRTQILQRTASTLVETYTCNLIISREACSCK